MTIRTFQERDEEAVVALWKDAFPDAPAWNDPAVDIRRKLSVQRDLFLVAEREGALVGTAMGGYDGHRGWVYYVAVSREERGGGVGRALMQTLEDKLRALGCPKLNLQVRATNTAVIEFYRKLGYEVEDRVSMSKRLE